MSFAISWFRKPKAARIPKRPLPCSLCGLCAKTDTDGHGYVCLWYDVYQSYDEATTSDGALRAVCLSDGNHFRFRLKGIRPNEMLEWRIRHTDWAATRRYATIGAVTGAVSLLVSIAVSVAANWP